MTIVTRRIGGRYPTVALCLPTFALLAGWHGAAAAPTPSQLPPGAPLHLVQQNDTRAVLRVTREQAIASAMKVVPGRVTSVDIERKGGKVVYVVEVQTPGGDETDVLIDVETGEVLGTE